MFLTLRRPLGDHNYEGDLCWCHPVRKVYGLRTVICHRSGALVETAETRMNTEEIEPAPEPKIPVAVTS